MTTPLLRAVNMNRFATNRAQLTRGMLCLGCLAMISCGKSNPELVSKNEPYSQVVAKSHLPSSYLPKLDILFVVDNAQAMKMHQENVSRNIDKFVDVFKAGSDSLDFHIGVTSLFDRTKWVKGEPGCDFDNGQLRTLKHLVPDPAHPGKSIIEDIPNRNFVTRDDDIAPILKQTLKLGEQPFAKCGYNYEEEFGPVVGAFGPAMMNGPNRGFYRQDAQLAVIFISDADDETREISSEQMAQFLLDLKGGARQLLTVVAVTTARDASDRSCPRDDDGPPIKLHDLVDQIQGTYLSLCSPDFGGELAKIGRQIKQKALSRVVILKQMPDPMTIEVRYGGTVVQPGEHGWTYDPEDHALTISGDVNAKHEAGAEISIDYVRIDMSHAFNKKRVHIIGHD